ncbi:MAG: UDP-N-acetylglucosamine 1-carboxyvinyltransferase [Alphaproteobacteria bacterium]
MDRMRIRGGKPLEGTIRIAGAKNAALPVMTAALLTDETLALSNVPHLDDIATLVRLLVQHGVEATMDGATAGGHAGNALSLTARTITSTVAPYELVRKMRASVLVLGPLVAREGEATVSLPGGCAIGSRPVDLHLKGLQTLGAEIEVEAGYIRAHARHGLTGARIVMPMVSVGATENLVMAATLARGDTVIENAAREPEIVDLVECLQKMGARIEGGGTDTLRIAGVDRLHGAAHAVMADRIETGTYAMAAAITGGTLMLEGARLDHVEAAAETLREAGVTVERKNGGIFVSRANADLVGVDVMTEPFPGFPTDLQAQFMALMATARGASMVTETIFENRFMHVPELRRMGANINLHGGSAMVRGVERLSGAPVMASDLRASASLVLAALAARGETEVNRIYHLDRGYERMEEKLAAVGADIERVKEAG